MTFELSSTTSMQFKPRSLASFNAWHITLHKETRDVISNSRTCLFILRDTCSNFATWSLIQRVPTCFSSIFFAERPPWWQQRKNEDWEARGVLSSRGDKRATEVNVNPSRSRVSLYCYPLWSPESPFLAYFSVKKTVEMSLSSLFNPCELFLMCAQSAPVFSSFQHRKNSRSELALPLKAGGDWAGPTLQPHGNWALTNHQLVCNSNQSWYLLIKSFVSSNLIVGSYVKTLFNPLTNLATKQFNRI